MNISLTPKGAKMSFTDFKKTFGKYFVAKPKMDINAEYERLTGKKVDDRSAPKESKEV